MTEKLYYTDSYMSEFSAVVTDIIKNGNETYIVLDKTAFFPEGGGQKSDTGYINDFRVDYVFIKNEIIYHVTENNTLNVGDSVFCRLDFDVRFARMQSHTGEHILSGIVHNLFGADNVGFHFDDGLIMTVDFNIPLSKEQLKAAEISANRCIYDNLPVSAVIYENDILNSVEFRSKIDFSGPARIVEIPGIDKCACCAPHVRFTGEIGLIKVLSSSSHRGGVRITLICGSAAFDDYADKYDQTLNISAALCSRHNETDIAVNNLLRANSELKFRLTDMKMKYLSLLAELYEEADFITIFLNDFEPSELRQFTDVIRKKSHVAVFVFSCNSDFCYSYCFYSEIIQLNSFVKEFNNKFSGSGGGKTTMFQGKVNASETDIKNYIESLKVIYYENEKKKES